MVVCMLVFPITLKNGLSVITRARELLTQEVTDLSSSYGRNWLHPNQLPESVKYRLKVGTGLIEGNVKPETNLRAEVC